MKVARKRKQVGRVGTQAPEGGNYWHYPNDTEAFKDFLKYLEATKFPKTVADTHTYIEELKKRGYFTDSNKNYYFGLMRFI